MYETIVVPLDGSALSEQAIPTAAAIAKRAGAALHVVLVHETPHFARTREQERWGEALVARDQAYVDERARELVERSGVRAAPVLLSGPVVPAICQHVHAARADLVVLTTHGRTGFNRSWLGSVADGLVRHAHVPVLMLRAAPQGGGGQAPGAPTFRCVLLPVDGSSRAEQVLRRAVQLCGVEACRYVLARAIIPIPLLDSAALYVPPTPLVPDAEATEAAVVDADRDLRRLADELRQQFRGLNVDVELRVSPSPADALLAVAESRRADLIALTSHGRGTSRLLLGSVADKLLRGSTAAMLIYRPTDE